MWRRSDVYKREPKDRVELLGDGQAGHALHAHGTQHGEHRGLAQAVGKEMCIRDRSPIFRKSPMFVEDIGSEFYLYQIIESY